MDAYYSYLNTLIGRNKDMFAEYPEINWYNPYNGDEYAVLRDRLLNAAMKSTLFKATKPYYNQISEGCRICGQGTWSCLFISSRCNASCFYCPAPQQSDDLPSSQGLEFPDAGSYAEYISFFKFKGVSFSGGEPLLVKDRLLEYLRKIRRNCSPKTYIWMYTNGLSGDKEIYDKLASLNLNEIRFDIGANAYRLDAIRPARNLIKNITIEIPAIPEEKERIKVLLPEMIKAGVTNLNLHQLRLTKHNATHLLKRPYTYIPAEKPVVLESELAALEIIGYARSHDLDIGINYCSFFFKNRFQPAGFRKQIPRTGSASCEITQNGYIREHTDTDIKYFLPHLADKEIPSENHETIALDHKLYYLTRKLIYRQSFEGLQDQINELITSETDKIPSNPRLFNIWKHEYIEKGLREL